jgi:hypothetical protein
MSFFPLGGHLNQYLALVGGRLRGRGAGSANVKDAVPALGAVGQQIEIANNGSSNSATYSGTFTCLDISIPFSVTNPASDQALTQGIIADLEANPLFFVVAEGTVEGVEEFYIQMREGFTGAITYSANPGTIMVTTITAEVEAGQFIFGRAVTLESVRAVGDCFVDVATLPTTGDTSPNLCLVANFGDYTTIPVDAEGPEPGASFAVACPGVPEIFRVEYPPAAPTHLGAVHVELSASGQRGRLLTASSGTSVQWTTARWYVVDSSDTAQAFIEYF